MIAARAGAFLLVVVLGLGQPAAVWAAPSAAALVRQGVALYNRGDYSRAVEVFRQAVRADPRSARGYAWLGLTLVKLDQPRQALEAFKRVVEIAPASDDARVARQWIRRLEDRLAGGRKPLEVGVQAPPFTLKDRTGILYRLDQYRGRRVVLLFVWSLDPQMRETVKDLDLRAGRTEGRYAAIVVALDVDRTAVRGFVTTENLSTPVLFGTSRVAELYGVTRGTALLYVISERGLVAQRQMGAIRPASVLP